MFRAATPGGDDFDGMAPATVSTGTTIKTSADFERPSVFRILVEHRDVRLIHELKKQKKLKR